MPLTEAQRRQWGDNGYLVVPGFFLEEEIVAVEASLEQAWRSRSPHVTVDDLLTGERLRINQVSEEGLQHNFKVNDLYLTEAAVRATISSARVVSLVGELLGDQPVVCNTLNLEKGSQQGDHLDTLYMTPRSEFELVATWMALEDTHPDAGPLRYWPGSHRIDPFRFSDGTLHLNEGQMEQWADYMAGALQHHGLASETFIARRGDLFIWNALLLHGGSPICNAGLSRNSLVTHFFSESDCRALGAVTRPVERGAGLWWDRPPQPIPGEVMTEEEEVLAERSAAEKLAVKEKTAVARRTSVFDRLRSLRSGTHH